MHFKRVNTLALDFSAVPQFPQKKVLHKFLKNIRLDPTKFRSVQIHSARKIVYIGLPEELSAATIAETVNLRVKIRSRGADYPIPVTSVEDDIVDVRVRDLPPETPNEVITEALKKFGEVLTIRNEVWKDVFPGVSSGVRVVGMKIAQNIPAVIMIGSSWAHIQYAGQTASCSHSA